MRIALIVGFLAASLMVSVPGTSRAQSIPPHIFLGTAFLDDDPAPNGTEVLAFIGGLEQGNTTVASSDGSYTLLVNDEGPGAIITFKVSGALADETAVWRQGGADVLDLHASLFPPAPLPVPVCTSEPRLLLHYGDGVLTADITTKNAVTGAINVLAIAQNKTALVGSIHQASDIPRVVTLTKEISPQGIVGILVTWTSLEKPWLCAEYGIVDTGTE